MRKSGADLVAYALEQVGVTTTFGIPGVHNTEIYDALARSETITPVLVTHEQAASFMADAVSRTSGSVGCIVVVPAAGVTHAMSGLGEAFLDGIPLIAISGGIRRDSGRRYQLHELDQRKLVEAITKAAFVVDSHDKVVPTIFEAYEIATSGVPGPVLVEVSAEVQLFSAEVSELPRYQRAWRAPAPDPARVQEAVALVRGSRKVGLYVGWGARDATKSLVRLAERLGAPVATTLQGISVFPHDHRLHAGFGWGSSAVPAARKAFEGVDCLVAIGCRFSELATGSYGMPVPENLIHVDIDPRVPGANYPAKVALEADAREFAEAFLLALEADGAPPPDRKELVGAIARDKAAFREDWCSKPRADQVSPGIFFRELRQRLERDAYVVLDDGNHTFLAAEQFPVYASGHLVSPTDFNCMGYCVPATIATKLAHPESQVCAIVGDGAFLMTGLEILTAATLGLGAVFFVFHDGELAQISQLQQIPLKHKTCTVLGDVRVEGVATATGAAYLRMEKDAEVSSVIAQALSLAAKGQPVIVDVNIDYSRRSVFTSGVVKTNLSRFPLREKVRFIGRAIKRHTVG
jgi:acetolactate synthase-1/2/3 large subunit